MRLYAERARSVAMGELERAKNIVNASPYTGESNDALAAALRADPPFVPGTTVEVRRVGGDWFVLRATGSFQGVTKTAQAFVRQRSPVSAYNFFVVDHPLGISGAPRGAIHSNKTVDFYFPGGFYRDSVTASEGFNYEAGATPENTTLLGQWDPKAPASNLLQEVDVAKLADKADTLAIRDDLLAEIEFKGKQTEVRLFRPQQRIRVPKTGVRRIFTGYRYEPQRVRERRYKKVRYTVERPVYKQVWMWVRQRVPVYEWKEVMRSKRVPVYEERTERYSVRVPIYAYRRVRKARRDRVWVEDPPPKINELEGGFAVGGSRRELGHWQWTTRYEWVNERYVSGYRTEWRTRTRRVETGYRTVFYTERKRVVARYENRSVRKRHWIRIGTRKVTKSKWVFSHYEYVTRYRRRPTYRTETYTYYETQTIPEKLVRTETVPTKGVIYIEKQIRSIKGRINGQVSVASNSSVKITGSLVYEDDAGNTRMLNGADPDKRYEFNPAYTGNSVLGIMSNDDIIYGREAPQRLEINASLISVNGKVASEGIAISDDGRTVSTQFERGVDRNAYVKESIRRLGGIVSRKRPVTTFVDQYNQVLAGFRKGISFMDRNLILTQGGNVSPPFVFQARRPTWVMSLAGRRMDAGS